MRGTAQKNPAKWLARTTVRIEIRNHDDADPRQHQLPSFLACALDPLWIASGFSVSHDKLGGGDIDANPELSTNRLAKQWPERTIAFNNPEKIPWPHNMESANIEQGVIFGPFRMPHLQELVNERMRQAFYSYLAQQVMPLLEGEISRIDGQVYSHYDRQEFAALAVVRRRYYYEITLSSATGVEDAWGELDYDPDTATYTPSRIKPPGVRTLTEKRQMEQDRQAELEFRRINLHHPGDNCPKCHSRKVAKILYGLYSFYLPANLKADLDAGRIRFGGCCVSKDSPLWHCLACGSSWGCVATESTLHKLTELGDQELGRTIFFQPGK
jgi:hypothetical protein